MAINFYDDNKITKGGIWVTIMKASCIMSFKQHVFKKRPAATWYNMWSFPGLGYEINSLDE